MKRPAPARIVCLVIFLSVCGGCFAPVLRAQDVFEEIYSALKWRMIGPFRAGKVNAVAGVPGQSSS